MKPNNFPLIGALVGTTELYTQTGGVSNKFTLATLNNWLHQNSSHYQNIMLPAITTAGTVNTGATHALYIPPPFVFGKSKVYAKLVYSIRIDDDGTTAQAQVKDIIANTNVTGLNVTLVNNTGDPFADFRGITDPTGAWIDITSKQHLAVEFKRVSGTGYVHLQGSSHVVLKYSNI